ncbi:hypothetical protein HAX54_007739 [Datura stramonium]|uniref:Uncharacterized protein n=1 Tax=Datura stramonium TaxID=4076 RepID=A0ABS8RHY2_DATST|nr:hypothetical protein [Datura stramonium]
MAEGTGASANCMTSWESQLAQSFQATAQPTLSFQATTQATPSVQVTSQTASSNKHRRPDCSIFPISFDKWPDLPKSYFNRCFDNFIKKAETGIKPGRAQLYLATHKKQDVSYVSKEARELALYFF